MKTDFNWSIECYRIKNSKDLLVVSFTDDEQDMYECEVISADEYYHNGQGFINGNVYLQEVISESVIKECCANTIKEIEEQLDITVGDYICGWDSSYYEDAVVSGMYATSEYDLIIERQSVTENV